MDNHINDVEVQYDGELRQIQDAERRILSEFIRVCDKYGLKYYMAEGSLLGAIRHGGMIPWDDDIDVSMPRADYERFLAVADRELAEPYRCRHYRNDPECIDLITKIIDQDTFVRSSAKTRDFDTNLWIDVFVIDGMPARGLARKLHKYRLLFTKLCLMLTDVDYYAIPRERPWAERFMIKTAKIIPIFRLFSKKKLLNRLDRAMASQSLKKGGDTVIFLSEYRFRTICCESDYADGRYADFDGMKVMIPQNAEDILTAEYGDYMKLPSIEKRGKHNLKLSGSTDIK